MEVLVTQPETGISAPLAVCFALTVWREPVAPAAHCFYEVVVPAGCEQLAQSKNAGGRGALAGRFFPEFINQMSRAVDPIGVGHEEMQ